MGHKNEGYYQKLDTTIQRLHMKQELYQESCHRLQLAEPQIETRISEILEKIWDSLENRYFIDFPRPLMIISTKECLIDNWAKCALDMQ